MLVKELRTIMICSSCRWPIKDERYWIVMKPGEKQELYHSKPCYILHNAMVKITRKWESTSWPVKIQ